ncbi:MAG TPA: PDZ domain-containing protein [Firmicutes bacterium]|nr:PDZ domain-containing protein [Bacillota bacterium]
MFPFGKILAAILTVLPAVIFNYIFWMVIFIVAMQYTRTAKLQERMYGSALRTPLQMTLTSALYGLAGGVAGSLVFVFLGVTLSGAGIMYVWPLALLLMLFDARFLCFSYAGGLVALSSLIFGFPKIGVPELMALVAVLHMIESILIWIGGDDDPVPVFLKDNAGRLLGGFALQRFWPIPVIAMMILSSELPELREMTKGLIQMPEWWPLIKPSVPIPHDKEVIYAMFAIPAALGYGDVAISRMPQERSRLTSRHLMVFSLVLLALSIASAYYAPFKFLAAVFSPVGHEAVIRIGRRTEFEEPPLFVPPPRGIMILDVVPGMPAARAGFESGDIILSINGEPVNSKADVMRCLEGPVPHYYIEGIRHTPGGGEKSIVKTLPGNIDRLGMIFVPEPGESFYMELMHDGILHRLFRRVRRK